MLLVEELAGLLNASVEQRPVLHNKLDILDGQVNDHASHLGCLEASHLLDVLVEDRADLFFVVRVLWHYVVDYGVANFQVALLHGLELCGIRLLLDNCLGFVGLLHQVFFIGDKHNWVDDVVVIKEHANDLTGSIAVVSLNDAVEGVTDPQASHTSIHLL